jgi:exonuclease SbcD
VGRPLRTVDGRLEDLLRDPNLEEARSARLRVRLTDEHLPLQAMARLRPRFPHIAELRHQPPERPGGGGEDRASRIAATLTPLERSLAFFTEQQGRDPAPAEAALLRQALESARTGGER